MTKSLRISNDGAFAEFHPDKGVLERWQLSINGDPFSVFYPPIYTHPSIANWPSGGCPILFPWAGRIWNGADMGRFQFADRQGSMPVHGMAYTSSVVTIKNGPNEVAFKHSNKKTKGSDYPWDFQATTTYKLAPKQLSINLLIENQDTAPMPIAPGIHPFFNVGDLTEWKVSIPANVSFAVTQKGLAGDSEPISIVDVSAASPKLQSLILGDLSNTTATITHTTSGRRIIVDWSIGHTNFVVLWTDQNAGYFCLEPWSGLPDAVHNLNGLKALLPGQAMTFGYRIILE